MGHLSKMQLSFILLFYIRSFIDFVIIDIVGLHIFHILNDLIFGMDMTYS
jgi:hypothetical protein